MLTDSNEKIMMLDPSLVFRPEEVMKKTGHQFRNYQDESNDPHQQQVKNTYLQMHTYQCVDYVKKKHAQWLKFDHFEATILHTLDKLNDLIDESDPDVNVPNIVHAFQTAERIREAHPDKDWFHLTGLIHDLGKIMAFYGEPQYSTVGDTFVVGCEFAPSIVYRKSTFRDNPDMKNEKFNTKYGLYEANCGLDKVMISWGHDEFLYQVLKHNKSTLPAEALYMIRYHSFYPWHTGGDYMYLCDNKDMEMIEWIKEFNIFYLFISIKNTNQATQRMQIHIFQRLLD
ncbi:unnamed protein product, partial [Meganyctiphanes norvegica]